MAGKNIEAMFMYIPAHFQIDDIQVSYDLIRKYSFATLFSQHDGLPWATHLPLILDAENRYLYGHFARANGQWKDIHNQMVLAVFHGPHCYISPSWYETPQAVPTWNYVSVHVYGEAELIDDEQVIQEHLQELVLKYEAPDSPYRLQDAGAEYLAALHRGLRAFRIRITRIEGKAKLSQNHSAERIQRVIDQLERIDRDGEQEIASLMRANLATLRTRSDNSK
jgi:transcriptional regulator